MALGCVSEFPLLLVRLLYPKQFLFFRLTDRICSHSNFYRVCYFFEKFMTFRLNVLTRWSSTHPGHAWFHSRRKWLAIVGLFISWSFKGLCFGYRGRNTGNPGRWTWGTACVFLHAGPPTGHARGLKIIILKRGPRYNRSKCRVSLPWQMCMFCVRERRKKGRKIEDIFSKQVCNRKPVVSLKSCWSEVGCELRRDA